MQLNSVVTTGAVDRIELRRNVYDNHILDIALAGLHKVGERNVYYKTNLEYHGVHCLGYFDTLAEGDAVLSTGHLWQESWLTGHVRNTRLVIKGADLHRLPNAKVERNDRGYVLDGGTNKIEIIGSLVKAPEIKVLDGGNFAIVKATLQWSTYNHKEAQPRNHYVEVEAHGDIGATLYAQPKGRKVYIQGALKFEVWTVAETKIKRQRRLVSVLSVTPLG